MDRPVEEEKLSAVLEAGRLAPSARNLQDWRFVVVRDPATRKRLAEAARNQEFVGQAPVVIAACGTSDMVMTCGQPAYALDVAIAVDHMTLAAFSLGLGTCWVVALLPLGYPDHAARPTPRKKLDEILAYERW